ncbi:hypothetical protein ACFFGR_03650 [Arthrobacter liuii]|uniref:Uncharacterized protein n=1 Tax=Arthrobacter liuii TaxID=1476996 RepID=A0ABQ2ATA4_9MICC|nr:hypothetical protein GCM10007170_19760 [Arthrobacter liuii]
MQFDLSSVETATLVFIGTLVFGAILAAFVLAAGLVALVVLGAGKLTWMVVVNTLMAVVHAINSGWDRLVHRASDVELPSDFPAQPSPGTGTLPAGNLEGQLKGSPTRRIHGYTGQSGQGDNP